MMTLREEILTVLSNSEKPLTNKEISLAVGKTIQHVYQVLLTAEKNNQIKNLTPYRKGCSMQYLWTTTEKSVSQGSNEVKIGYNAENKTFYLYDRNNFICYSSQIWSEAIEKFYELVIKLNNE